MPGPIPKPLSQKIQEGNPGKQSKEELNLNQATPEPLLIQEPPDYLSEEAKQEYRKLAPVLFRNGLLTEIDYPQFEILCQSYGYWVAFEKKAREYDKTMLIKNGAGVPTLNPYIRAAMNSMDNAVKFLQLFGMSPSARMRVKAEKGEKDDEGDAWARLVKQREEIRKKHLIKNEN